MSRKEGIELDERHKDKLTFIVSPRSLEMQKQQQDVATERQTREQALTELKKQLQDAATERQTREQTLTDLKKQWQTTDARRQTLEQRPVALHQRHVVPHPGEDTME